MPRYVNADWLLERAVPIGWSTPKWVSDIVIEDAPTADVRENVHAHWVIEREQMPNGEIVVGQFCSNCDYPQYLTTRFCPNCGAVMDERSEE